MSAELRKLEITLNLLNEKVWFLDNKQKEKLGLTEVENYFIKASGMGWEILDSGKNCIRKLSLVEGFHL